MSKDLLKRAEKHLQRMSDASIYDRDADGEKLIQELLDKLKGDAERLDSPDFREQLAHAISCHDMPRSQGEAVINVLKGDDNDS